MLNMERYKDQIVSAIKEHLPDTGPSPEKNMSALSVNREYIKDIKALGKIVALKKHERIHERKIGDIVIPISNDIGMNMSKAEILSLGKEALKYNLNINDIVLYDHYSVHYDHHPNVVTNIENILCKIENNNFIPIGKYVEVELTDISLTKKIENIILLEDSVPKFVYEIKQLGTGYENFQFPVKIGDKILIGGNPSDDISLNIMGNKKLFIFCDNIIAFVI